MELKEFKRMEKQVESCLSPCDLMSLAAFGTEFKGFHDTAKALGSSPKAKHSDG